jgi:hypothetical protein
VFMDLTEKEREIIYDEERARRECGGSDHSGLLFLLNLGAIAGLAGILLLSRDQNKRITLETLRKAYPGLSPEEEQKL